MTLWKPNFKIFSDQLKSMTSGGSQGSPRGMCVGLSDTGNGFSHYFCIFLSVPCHQCPIRFIYLSWTIYNINPPLILEFEINLLFSIWVS